MEISSWKHCLEYLEGDLPLQQFNTWIRPLQVVEKKDVIHIFAPNRFVRDWVSEKYLERIQKLLNKNKDQQVKLTIGVGNKQKTDTLSQKNQNTTQRPIKYSNNLNKDFNFENFIEGKSNQLARAASLQVARNPRLAYNPLFIYGGVGLGKTHLMHAIGHAVAQEKQVANIAYLHSERFVADMVRALQHNVINEFKRYYRSLDLLLIDDIQFFAGKERSQEEFFHTFNALLEGQHQVVLTCDRYPKEVDGLEERLRSRFGWGLTVSIDPPELETRVAIVNKKAQQVQIVIPDDVAFFIAERFRSNVRELEGALNRVIASARLTQQKINIEFARLALRDLLLIQDKQVSIENIQRTVAGYYKIRVTDLLSKRRSRSVARPRQVAMAITKKLTSHSLPEIGDRFGGRDHTTVLHACRKVEELRKTEQRVQEDYVNLVNTLTR